MNPRIIAFIFARGGSKGLPRKNLLPLAGKPLVVHSIHAARSVPRVARVVVSTDDPEIAEVARQAGADVPFLRPAELAGDSASEWLAWRHAIRTLRESGDAVDVFLSLPPTSPLRVPSDIECCLDLFIKTSPDAVITVRDAERNPYFNMVRHATDGFVRPVIEGSFHRRQDAPAVYDIATVAYVARPEFVLSADRLFDGNIRAVQIPRERAIDIDTEFDLIVARSLASTAFPATNARALS